MMGKPVMQWQILSKNPDASSTFYSKLFDWKVNADNPLGYRMIDTGSKRGINGGIWPSPPDGHAFVQLFVEVDDMGATVTKATRLGAKVLIPPQTLPGGDELAILHDPEGIPLGIYRPAK
ncbi:MAG: VOC family protein [Planctomycetes bacterium]|nr:VOC family protein [Planctomycetota bacterium]MBI3844382.1 VOC family protein [Planctomycetota bacterium]